MTVNDRTRRVLGVLCDVNETPHRQSVKSSDVAARLELSTKQVAQEMRKLHDQGYLGRFTDTTPIKWELFPEDAPDPPDIRASDDTSVESDA